ncbi:GyrI-like domain-containing protein [Aquimarina sp. I32.4]|uniref:AraC family transcriptional regulator n=1 Tax=Aquimarina sp. I32.4 TaxID=2053903 RepID=UPI000CDEC4C7|nr:AraC family transcriptional regulator [Aquimarina sp. I32.4]
MSNLAHTTRQEYIKRINDVIDFIENNLDTDLSLETLSKKAHYSSFHFHRIFAVYTGETLNTFINRRRIERIASILLVGTTTPLNRLAYTYGFNSDNSFSRAFRKYYGVSPTDFKSKGTDIISKIGIEPLTIDKYICSIENIKKWMDMYAQVEIKDLQEIQLAGIAHIGDFDKIENTYKKLFEWASQKGVLDTHNTKAITIYHDNAKVTQASKIRFSACVTVHKYIKVDGEIRPITIQKGTYAIGHFEITTDAFQKAWDSMCVWVIESGYDFKDGQYFEIYHNDPNTHPQKKCIVDICIPIKNSDIGTNNSILKTSPNNLEHYREEIKKGQIQIDYQQLISYIKILRTYFIKEYPTDFTVGKMNQGSMNHTYFSITTASLKKQKLKFVIIFNHQKMRFEICLSGQNKAIRKKYWNIFKNSDWNTYFIPESIENRLSIIEHLLVENPNFDISDTLTDQIEKEAFIFMNEIRRILEVE